VVVSAPYAAVSRAGGVSLWTSADYALRSAKLKTMRGLAEPEEFRACGLAYLAGYSSNLRQDYLDKAKECFVEFLRLVGDDHPHREHAKERIAWIETKLQELRRPRR
jgi:hypothetical protein